MTYSCTDTLRVNYTAVPLATAFRVQEVSTGSSHWRPSFTTALRLIESKLRRLSFTRELFTDNIHFKPLPETKGERSGGLSESLGKASGVSRIPLFLRAVRASYLLH